MRIVRNMNHGHNEMAVDMTKFLERLKASYGIRTNWYAGEYLFAIVHSPQFDCVGAHQKVRKDGPTVFLSLAPDAPAAP